MKIYNYDAAGIYVSQTEADKSPLETDVYLLPALATFTKPPECNAGQVCWFDGQGWQVKADVRGKWYGGLGEVVVDSLSSDVSALTRTPPPSAMHSLTAGLWNVDPAKAAAKFAIDKVAMLADYKIKRDAAITRCMTLHTQLVAFGQPLDAASCLEVVTALLAVFQHATVTSATTIAAFDATIRTQYGLAFAKATPGAKLAYAARDK